MNIKVAQELVSWLKFLDVEYLDECTAVELAKYDINEKQQQLEVFEIAIKPEFDALNKISQEALKVILFDGIKLSNAELEAVFSRIAMPFSSPVTDQRAFLCLVRDYIFGDRSEK